MYIITYAYVLKFFIDNRFHLRYDNGTNESFH